MRRLHYAWVVLAMGTLIVFVDLGLGHFGYTAMLPEPDPSLAFRKCRNSAYHISVSGCGTAESVRNAGGSLGTAPSWAQT
jgi:hypothetical protein